MSADSTETDLVEYVVVTNDEGQYSIWPKLRNLPIGWTACEFRGTKEACLSHIEQIWTDMRPISLRF